MDKVDWDYWYAYDLEAGIWHWSQYPGPLEDAFLIDEEWDQ